MRKVDAQLVFAVLEKAELRFGFEGLLERHCDEADEFVGSVGFGGLLAELGV